MTLRGAVLATGGAVVLWVGGAVPASACTVRLKADGNTAAIQHALDRPGNPLICLESGVYKGARLVAARSARIRNVGKDRVVLSAGSQGRVLTVMQAGIDVVLEGITLTDGKAPRGGGVALDAASRVTLRDCWLTQNTATSQGGGGISASAGEVVLVRSRVTHNVADIAAAIDLTGTAKARIVASLIADNQPTATGFGPLRLSDAASLDLRLSTLAYNGGNGVYLQPSGQGRTRATLDSVIVMGKPDAVAVSRTEAEHVTVSRSVLHGAAGYVPKDLATTHALPGFDLVNAERYRPIVGSAAIARGRCSGADAGRDLSGRLRSAVCSAGALEAAPDVTRKTLQERAKAAQAQPKESPW
ncbi:MAG: hypothetical protein EXR79_11640 [Myxococcales bacterium]|nr:hypothetical protein [Myxococcales bacterium]